MTSPSFPQSRSAFSLVEVVFAMGLASFCLVSVMALTPVGLGTMRQAIDKTVEGNIVREIGGQALVTPYSELNTQFSSKSFYFDEEGQRQASPNLQTRHWVTTQLGDSVFPGSENAPQALGQSLTLLKVAVVTAPHPAAANRTESAFNIQIPNSGN